MSPLSTIHQHHILSVFLSIHRQMAELDALMDQSARITPLSQTTNDLSPDEAEAIRDHFNQIRTALLGHLQDCEIPLEVRQNSLHWVVQSNVMHLQVMIDDMRPKRLSAYGPLNAEGKAAVLKIQQDLARRFEVLRNFLGNGTEHNPSQ